MVQMVQMVFMVYIDESASTRLMILIQGLKVFGHVFFCSGKFSSIITAASVFFASSFRDMQGIGIIPAISSGTSSAFIQNKQLL